MDHLDYGYLFKVNIVGNGTVGKTSMLNRFVTGVFDSAYKTTIGSQFAVKLVPLSNDKSAYLQIWDVAGQARFDAVRKMYYSGTAGIIIVYDITRESSFKSVQKWVHEAFENTAKEIPVAIVGNKADLQDERTVDSARGATYAAAISEKFDVPTIFLETSAVTDQNIDKIFSEFAEAIIHYQTRLNFGVDFRETPNSRVVTNGWHQTKMNLACHDKKYVLRYLGFPELCGLLVTTEELLSVLTERGDFSEGIDALRTFLMTRLEQQVKSGSQTFDLDIDRLLETEAARFVDDIIALRFEEIRSLSVQVNSEFDIDPWALWKTYYGRMLIKSTKSPRELNLRETRNMLRRLEIAGIPVGLES
ncbi:MAG: Rab family GTPase [Candidatus Thorarchaeota archaeon]